jgi:hypothetical protein
MALDARVARVFGARGGKIRCWSPHFARQQKFVALEGSVGSFTIEALVSPELQTSATMRDPMDPQGGVRVHLGQFKLIGSSDSYLI